MNKSIRFLFQALLWLGLWLILWTGQNGKGNFLLENGPVYLLQLLLIAGVIYYAAPALLLKRKYVLFGLLAVGAVVLGALVSDQFFNPPKPPRMEPFMGPPRRVPSRFFIQLLFLSLSFMLATFLETFIFAQKKEEETIRNRNENLQNELKLLKSQINPHFLFNALNNIYALAAIDPNKTQQSISYLSNMLRYVIYDCEQALVPINKEIDYIENYLKLYSLKASKAYPISTDFKVLNDKISIAPMLLIPFVENALKHSNLGKDKDSFLNLMVKANNDGIQFKIANSIPNEAIQKDEVGGIGLENVRKRLSILYPEKHQLLIDESNDSFKVDLNIQLI